MDKKTYYIAALTIFTFLSQPDVVFASTNNMTAEGAQEQESPNDRCDKICNATIRGVQTYCERSFPRQHGGVHQPDPRYFAFTQEDCDRVLFHEWWEDPDPAARNNVSRVCDPVCNADPSNRLMNEDRFQQRVLKRLTDERQALKDKVTQYDNANPNGPELPFLYLGRKNQWDVPIEQLIGDAISEVDK